LKRLLICKVGRDGEEGEDDHGDGGGGGDWGRSHNSEKDGLWDDVDGGSLDNLPGRGGRGLDLADFAAAALKFRSETQKIGVADFVRAEGAAFAGEEDAMERLLREQNDVDPAAQEIGAEVPVQQDNVEDDDVPEWADADVNEPIELAVPTATAGNTAAKRNLLLEVNKHAISALTWDRTPVGTSICCCVYCQLCLTIFLILH
jgi:hypothetical protein